MKIDIDQRAKTRIQKRLSLTMCTKVIQPALRDLAEFTDRSATSNLNNRIYKKPPSPSYTKTGRALAGHRIDRVTPLTFILVQDSRIKNLSPRKNSFGYTPKKSPRINYLPFLDKNSRISKLNTHYWTDAKEWSKRSWKLYFRNALRKAFKETR
jgi:hypothetical protein